MRSRRLAVAVSAVDPGHHFKLDLRFTPLTKTVKSGDAKLREAHQVDPENEEAPPGALVVDNGPEVPEGGMLEVDTRFTPDVAGDSAFVALGQRSLTFKVTAKKGSRLYYYCAIHPWIQGKLTVN